jgi:iron(III) transport system substrate-binding protein
MVQIKLMDKSIKKERIFAGLLISLIIATLVILLTACSTAEADIEDSLTGEIVVYTTTPEELVERYLAIFKKEYPDIKVTYVRASTGPTTERLLAEADNPQADLIWGLAATSLLIIEWYELLQPYSPKGLERVDQRFRDLANPPHWVGTDVWMSAFCVNTVEIDKFGIKTPQSWEDLLDPMYAGYLVMPNPNSSGTGFLSLSGIIQLYREAGSLDYLDKLHQNMGVYTHSGSKPTKLVAKGDYPIGIAAGYQCRQRKNDGAPVSIIFPTEGSGWDMKGNALLKKENIKPAAKTFLDWAISDSAMKGYAQDKAVTSVETDHPVPEGFPADPKAQLIDNDFPWVAANRKWILERWLTNYDEKSEPKD